IALPEKCRAFRVETASQEIDGNATSIFTQNRRIPNAGKGVIIGNEIIRFAFGLESDGGPHHPEVITDVEDAAGLYARKNTHKMSIAERTWSLLLANHRTGNAIMCTMASSLLGVMC